jgi:hypothetical protein
MTLGGAANEAAKGLSSSPILLLIAVINVILIGAMIYVAKAQADERNVLTKYLIDCQRVHSP